MSTKVLVVEDDLEINELIGEYLGLEKIQYLQAATGQTGIHLATKEHPDAVILDLMLPDIDGFEVARTLSRHRGTHDIPIIVLSCMCHDCDREKAFSSGALFFMNKPFLPDDLIAKVREALEWKNTLRDRNAAATVPLGLPESGEGLCSAGINQMIADLFARTDLSEAVVEQIRGAMETLGGWARQWNAEHAGNAHRSEKTDQNGNGNQAAPSQLKVEYRIGPRENNSSMTPMVEWKLTEDHPGMLAEAFFSETPAEGNGRSGGGWGAAAGLLGWASGTAAKPQIPLAPPVKWLQVLAKTGAARFEKESKTRTIRFSRSASSSAAGTPITGPVPVVEIDGTRYPTRLRDEALAAKRR